jgi:hypothetical protein
MEQNWGCRRSREIAIPPHDPITDHPDDHDRECMGSLGLRAIVAVGGEGIDAHPAFDHMPFRRLKVSYGSGQANWQLPNSHTREWKPTN